MKYAVTNAKKLTAFLLAAALVVLMTMTALADSEAKINTSKVVLRSSASKSSKALQTLDAGTSVWILKTKGDWYKVSYGRYTGYVMKQFVDWSGASAQAAPAAQSSSGSSTGSSGTSSSGGTISKCKKGDRNDDVKKLQQALADQGFYTGKIDGVFGNGTDKAVRAFQKAHGLKQDGVAGKQTIAALWGGSVSVSASSGTSTETLDWFNGGSNVIPKGATFTVKDCKTGKTWKAKRWSGGAHMDSDPLTKEDTDTMLSVWGGISWSRRAVLVKYNGHVYAGSMVCYPHGENNIKDNGFDGHFCIHFTGSKTHGTQVVDKDHQNAINTALKYTW